MRVYGRDYLRTSLARLWHMRHGDAISLGVTVIGIIAHGSRLPPAARSEVAITGLMGCVFTFNRRAHFHDKRRDSPATPDEFFDTYYVPEKIADYMLYTDMHVQPLIRTPTPGGRYA